MLLRDAHVEGAIGELLAEAGQAHGVQHGRGDCDDILAPMPDLCDRVAEHARPRAAAVRRRTARHGIDDAHRMELVRLVRHRRAVAAALLRDRVDDDGAVLVVLRQAQRAFDGLLVVSVDGSDVLEAQCVEHARPALGRHVAQSPLDAAHRGVGRASGRSRLAQSLLAPRQDPLVAVGGAQRVQVRGQAAHRRLIGAAVVVDDDDEPAVRLGAVRRDRVERFPRDTAGQRAVTDHRDDPPVVLAADLVRLRDPVRPRQRGRGVGVLQHVVLTLRPRRIPGQSVPLPQRREPVAPAGDHLVDVRLVTDVQENRVPGALEHTVEGERQLDDSQVGSQMAARPRHGRHQFLTDLLGIDLAFSEAEPAEVGGRGDGLQEGHRGRLPRWTDGRSMLSGATPVTSDDAPAGPHASWQDGRMTRFGEEPR